MSGETLDDTVIVLLVELKAPDEFFASTEIFFAPLEAYVLRGGSKPEYTGSAASHVVGKVYRTSFLFVKSMENPYQSEFSFTHSVAKFSEIPKLPRFCPVPALSIMLEPK